MGGGGQATMTHDIIDRLRDFGTSEEAWGYLKGDEIAELKMTFVEAATLLERQQRMIEEAREALVNIRDGDTPRPVGTVWRADGKLSKNDQCTHGEWMYDDCGACTAAYIDAFLQSLDATPAKDL